MRFILAVLLVIGLAGAARAQDWANSPANFENSPANWRNSPSNWENSPSRWGNERIVRTPDGTPEGYVVPKPDGGANVFDLRGNRRGYLPPEE